MSKRKAAQPMAEPNGKLHQLHGASQRSQWIGWVIIGGLWSILMVFGVGWMKSNEATIKGHEVELKQLQIAHVTEKGRVDAQAVQIQTLIGVMTRVEEFMRNLDQRLTRMELSQEQKTRRDERRFP